MDDYMKEMMDLKTLVTKTLEKKGVLARIRAELRANVFQAIEEQDHVSENEGSESFALLGRCSDRAKQLHSTPAGKLLTSLLCEYLEWCELDRTLKVYLPELNESRSYSRGELEELLEIKSEKNVTGVSSETRPLLLEVLEGYLKSEQTTLLKDSYAVSSSFPKSSRTSSSLGSKPMTNGLDIGDEDLRGALESRLTLSNKVVDQMTSSLDISVERYSGGPWHSETCSPSKDPASSLRPGRIITPAVDKVSTTRLDESVKDSDKPSGRLSLLGDLPPISGRRGGLAPMVLANSSGRANGILASAGGNQDPIDVSASGMQTRSVIGGGRDSGAGKGYLANVCSSKYGNGAHASSLGLRREDLGASNKEQYGSFGENRTKKSWREPDCDVGGSKREAVSNLADSGSVGSLYSTLQEHSRGHVEKVENSISCVPSSPDVRKSRVTTGDDTSCVKTKSGELCFSQQEDTFQFSSCLDDKTTLSGTSVLREKSASAYFYSESDDDVSIPVEEDFNEDSDGQSDSQF